MGANEIMPPKKKDTSLKKTTTPRNVVKKKKATSKKTNEVDNTCHNSTLSSDDSMSSERALNFDVESLLKNASLAYHENVRKAFSESKQDMTQLASIVEEYMSSFALIGFSMTDEKVVMLNMPTPKDESALVELLRLTMVDLFNNRQ
jgi:hypothetical protein